jgi:hypothetical protein
MQTFLSQQRKQGGKASSSNNAKGINPAVDACVYLNANQHSNSTTQQRIATELAGCDILLSGYFNAESGFEVIKRVKMTRPLLTKDGMVPESHRRLSKIMVAGQTTPHSLHLYSHPYGSLEIDDLVKYLADTVREFGLGQGVMGLSAWDPLSLSVNLELLFGDDLVLHFLMLRLLESDTYGYIWTLSSHSLIDMGRMAKVTYDIS